MFRVSFVVCFPNFLTVKIDLLYMNTENEFIGVRNRGFSSVKNLEASVSCEHEILVLMNLLHHKIVPSKCSHHHNLKALTTLKCFALFQQHSFW